MKRLDSLFHTLLVAFRTCLVRFPVAVGFVVALTVFLLYWVAVGGEEKWQMTLCYYLSLGTLLSLSLHLWGEEVKSVPVRWATHIVMHLLLLADAVFLYQWSPERRFVDIIIAHAAGVLAVWLSVFFLSFFKEKDDIASWNFTLNTVGTSITVFAVGAIMSGGISLLTFSLHQLFGMDVGYKCYGYILVLCCVLLPMLLFLGLLPQGENKHDRVPQPTAFLNGIVHYLFLPLAIGYLLVLYVYAARILNRWELPDGWVSWLVVTLMMGCICIEFSLYPARIKETRRLDDLIARWLPALALPLLLLMTVGIVRRFSDYGITLNRLYLATLNGWFYFVCIGLMIGRARRINWIPISFSIIFLLTSVLPVNYASITRNVLKEEVKALMAQNKRDSLPLSEKQYRAWLESLPEGGKQVNEKLRYLSAMFGEESVADIVSRDVSFHAIHAIREEQRHYEYEAEIRNHRLPRGYSLLTSVRLQFGLSQAEVREGEISVKLPTTDTFRLPIDTLRAWDKDNTLPPPVFRTVAGNVLLVSSFYLHTGQEGRMTVTLGGLLFHNEQTHNNK